MAGHASDRSYFDGLMPERQALLWAVAVRRQLDRWEPLVALHLDGDLKPPSRRSITSEEMWRGEVEHHFLLIAAANLLHAIPLLSEPPVIDPTVRAELKEVRDLLEHWTDNMPVFNVRPRTSQPPRTSGRSFAARNPVKGPYGWWNWSSKDGPRVTPHVTAQDLRALADSVPGHRGGARSSP